METEALFLAALGPDLAVFHSELAALARVGRRRRQRAESFEVTRSMQDSNRVIAHNRRSAPEATAPPPPIDNQLDYEVTRVALGPSAEARRRIRSDRPLPGRDHRLAALEHAEEACRALAASRTVTVISDLALDFDPSAQSSTKRRTIASPRPDPLVDKQAQNPRQ